MAEAAEHQSLSLMLRVSILNTPLISRLSAYHNSTTSNILIMKLRGRDNPKFCFSLFWKFEKLERKTDTLMELKYPHNPIQEKIFSDFSSLFFGCWLSFPEAVP